MTTCILHTGTEKTGSTSLQRFIGLNLDFLAARGIHVPRSLTPYAASGNFNHIKLTTASALSLGRLNDLQRALGLSSMAQAHAHRAEVAAEFRAEIAQLAEKPAYILVSNEHVHSRLRHEEDLRLLRALLEEHCTDFRVVTYLRPQYELAQSLAMTALRNGKPEVRLLPSFAAPNGFDPVLGVDFGYFDYASLLTRLENVFGREAMVVRHYPPSAPQGGDTIADFCACIGIDIIGARQPRRENARLLARPALFLAALNRHLANNPALPALRGKLMAALARQPEGEALLPARAEAQAFMTQFEACNDAVRARWFPERARLFEVDWGALPENAAPGALSEADAFACFAALLRDP